MKKSAQVNWYPYMYVYKGKKTFLLWQGENQQNCFMRNSNNLLVSAGSLVRLKRLVPRKNNNIKWSEHGELDLDSFWRALKHLKKGRASSKRTCNILLNGFNFIEDMLRTFDLKEAEKKLHVPLLDKAYKKLFWGSNLPSITPNEKSYHPLWLQREISILNSEFKAVWQTIRKKGYIVG